jgi:hypothetical protein
VTCESGEEKFVLFIFRLFETALLVVVAMMIVGMVKFEFVVNFWWKKLRFLPRSWLLAGGNWSPAVVHEAVVRRLLSAAG